MPQSSFTRLFQAELDAVGPFERSVNQLAHIDDPSQRLTSADRMSFL